MDLCLDLELGMGYFIRNFLAEVFIQADTAITQCCNFSRDSLALKTENGALSGVVYRVKSTGPSTEPCGTPYEIVTLSDIVSLIVTDWCLFCK